MKSLQRVQKAANVLRILAKIGYILTIVGTIFCVLGAIFCGIFGSNATVREWLAKEGTTFVTREYVCYCVCAAIGCASGIALAYFNLRFYEAELAAGTPFTKPLVKELRKLGLLHILLPIAASIVVAIVSAAMRTDVNFDTAGGISAGIAYLLLSLPPITAPISPRLFQTKNRPNKRPAPKKIKPKKTADNPPLPLPPLIC